MLMLVVVSNRVHGFTETGQNTDAIALFVNFVEAGLTYNRR